MVKKILIILIIALSVICFTLLARHGFKHTRGIAVVEEEPERPILSVQSLDKEIDLSQGIDLSFWQNIPAERIELLYQLMVLPWPKKSVPYVEVKAFHNRKDIYFYLEWPDETQDSTVGISKFSDAGAVMFPLGEETQASTLMMGFLGRANIWHWKAIQDSEYWLKEHLQPRVYVDFYYPFEEEELFVVSKEEFASAVNDLLAIRVGTITHKPIQNVQGRGIYEQGKWKVVFKRSLPVVDNEVDAQFPKGEKLCAFAAWDGSKGDRGGRKSISNWVTLVIK
ncbi:MAG: ethylbenzene dehydrogenase-related protein [Omnitrophica bacterium]|nr:ethylbenzene dehydrogenase-related protein [Candidatus Omnitrophota bacterium]